MGKMISRTDPVILDSHPINSVVMLAMIAGDKKQVVKVS